MIPQRFILAGLAGAVAFLAVEAAQLARAVAIVNEQGASLRVGPVDVKIAGPGAPPVKLPADAVAAVDNMHLIAAGAAVAVAIVAAIAVKG